VAYYSNYGVVEPHKMGLSCFPKFNEYIVGFQTPLIHKTTHKKFEAIKPAAPVTSIVMKNLS
jgi:hypothetical protein